MRFVLIFTSAFIIQCSGFSLKLNPFSPISVASEIRSGLQCIKDNIARGNIAAGLPAFDPLNVNQLTFNFDQIQARFLSGYVTLYHFFAEGITDWHIATLDDKISFAPFGFHVDYAVTIPRFAMNGDYKMNVLFNDFRYFGRGHVNMQLHQISISGQLVIALFKGIDAYNFITEVNVLDGQMQVTGFMDDELYSHELSIYLTEHFAEAVRNNRRVIDEAFARLLMRWVNNRDVYEEYSGFNFARIMTMLSKRCQPLPTWLVNYIIGSRPVKY